MEITFEVIESYALGMLLTAAFCYGLTASLRMVNPLNNHAWFRAFLPVVPGGMGAVCAVFVPFFWPEATTPAARAVLGAVAGFNMGTLYDFTKRIIGVYGSRAEAKLQNETTPNPVTVDAPKDETPRTPEPPKEIREETKVATPTEALDPTLSGEVLPSTDPSKPSE